MKMESGNFCVISSDCRNETDISRKASIDDSLFKAGAWGVPVCVLMNKSHRDIVGVSGEVKKMS